MKAAIADLTQPISDENDETFQEQPALPAAMSGLIMRPPAEPRLDSATTVKVGVTSEHGTVSRGNVRAAILTTCGLILSRGRIRWSATIFLFSTVDSSTSQMGIFPHLGAASRPPSLQSCYFLPDANSPSIPRFTIPSSPRGLPAMIGLLGMVSWA